MSAEHERERLALDALLGSPRVRERARAELARDPLGEAERLALAEELALARSALRADVTPGAEERVIAAVLARTTRSSRARRATSAPMLRAAAAALLCVGAAALAYRALRGGEDLARTDVARLEAPSEAPRGAPHALAEAQPPRWNRDEHAEALARDRSVLERSGTHAPAFEVAPDAPFELQLLAERAQVMRGSPEGAGAASAVETLPADPGPLAVALWTDLQLDRVALGHGPAEGLDDACERLERFAADPALAVRADGTATLVRSALGRAVGLGLAEGPPPAAAPALLEPEWFAALERAGREHGFGGRVPVGQLARPAR